ncbi:MAG: hypothetical protein L0216_16060 [Planctomycetales bacterium]|nr:hypothetical protein [Planctomycetales bacterium]
MTARPTQEQVVFGAVALLLAWSLIGLFGAGAAPPPVPPMPSGGGSPDAAPAEVPLLPSEGPPLWNAEGRNAFEPRRETTDLPPVTLPVPPAPAASILRPLPRPGPAAGKAASAFRRPADPAEKVAFAAAPPAEGDGK